MFGVLRLGRPRAGTRPARAIIALSVAGLALAATAPAAGATGTCLGSGALSLPGAGSCGISVDKKVAVGSGGAYVDAPRDAPSFADEGDTLLFALAVRNGATKRMTIDSVADAGCTKPTLAAADRRRSDGKADGSPTTFDPGDVWTWRCSHVLAAADPEPFVNTVLVTGHICFQELKATDSTYTSRYGRLVVEKVNRGGPASDVFTFAPSGALPAGAVALRGGQSHLYARLLPNAGTTTKYVVTEQGAAGYSLADLRCRRKGGAEDADSKVSLAERRATVILSPGETVTCTFTNEHETTLTVVKRVVNDDGGTKVASDFALHVDATGAVPAAFAGSESGVRVSLRPGPFRVYDDAARGYSGRVGATCSGEIAVGAHVVCEIVNDDVAPKLTVVKEVVNRAGSADVPADFTMSIAGAATGGEPVAFPGSAAGTTVRLRAGAYAVDESGGHIADFARRDRGDCAGTLHVGDEKRCTIENTRRTGTIAIAKRLVPAADPGRFDLLLDGVAVRAGAGDGDATEPIELATGTHEVAEAAAGETALDDYVRAIACTDGHGAAVASNADGQALAVPVRDGDRIACVVTNTRKAKVVVRKLTSPQSAVAFGFRLTPGDAAFSLAHGGEEARLVAPATTYTVAEDDPQPQGHRLRAAECAVRALGAEGDEPLAGAVDLATRSATFTPAAGDTVTCTFHNERVDARIDVDKSGPAIAYAGDTLTFDFAVRNAGDESLHDVDVADDRCAPVVRIDGEGDTIEPGEEWHYRCAMRAPEHALGQPNPVVNTATATARDGQNRPVHDDDTHATRFLHPAIAIDKDGPASAVAGEAVGYALTVTNPGDMAFAEQAVVVADALCEAPPVRTATNGDPTPATLDPGDRWTYACQVRTERGQQAVANVATVTGTDANGRSVEARDDAVTALSQPAEPAQEVLGTTAAPPAAAPPAAAPPRPATPRTVARGTARLTGPRGCPVTSVVRPTVIGAQIARVTFALDARRVRTVTRADARGRWRLALRVASLSLGTHRLTARVEFAPASRTAPRTLRMTVARCRPAAARFTG